jgi:hypothetical protein
MGQIISKPYSHQSGTFWKSPIPNLGLFVGPKRDPRLILKILVREIVRLAAKFGLLTTFFKAAL